MKAIFTYPNNAATDYIDPNYYGTDTTGFKGRIKDLQDGNYKSWNDPVNRPNLNVPLSTVIKTIATFNDVNALEDTGGNNTIYKFWEQPITIVNKQLFQEDLDRVDYLTVGGQVVVALTRTPDGVNDALGFYDGQEYDYTGDNWPQVTNTPSMFYAYHVGAVGTADQDKLYPKINGQELDADQLIIGEAYQIKSVGTTDFTTVGSANNTPGTLFTATANGTGTGVVDTAAQTYIQPYGAPEAFAVFRNDGKLQYAKGATQGTWSNFKFAAPASGYNNTYWQRDPAYETNFLLSNPVNGAVGDIAVGYESGASLSNGLVTGVAIVAGYEYAITQTGTADWTTVGAADNNLGTVFTSTSTVQPTGTGSVSIISNNNKLLQINGAGGAGSGGTNTSQSLLESDLTTFPVELWDGTLTDGTWTEIDLDISGTIVAGTFQTITSTQFSTFAQYAAGVPFDDGTPIPGTTSMIGSACHYGYAYVNLELTNGSIVGNSVFPTYNATNYPANINNWDRLYTWRILDNGPSSGATRYQMSWIRFQNFYEVQTPAREYNGYLIPGRKYEAIGGGTGQANTWAAAGATSVSAGNFVNGETYVIETVGNTDFIALGASLNQANIVFTANGSGSGTGSATEAVFTATNAGTYSAGAGVVAIYPYLGAQSTKRVTPDPWDKQSIARLPIDAPFNIPSNTYFNVTSGSVGKLRVGFVKPTEYNADMLSVSSQAITGSMTIDQAEPNRYRAYSSQLILPGNLTYMQRTGASTYVPNAQVVPNTYYLPTGLSGAQTGNIGDYAPGVSATGYLNGVILNPRDPGEFPSNSDVMLLIETVPDTYTPPAPTPIEVADTFDTEDQWASDGYIANPAKEWPDHVTPMSAEINYSSPTIANLSQSGIKYTRSAGHTKWQLDVVYPPMSASDFKIFHAISQAAHGQSTPFYFNLIAKDGGRILWKDFYDQTNTTTTPRFKDPIVAGDTLALFEGFASNEANAFMQGEVFIDGQNENGNLHTALSGTAANVYGEAKIRTPWPYREPQSAGGKIYKDPFHAVVTLADDNFTWSVDVNNYYYVSVSFDLDNWK